MARIYPFRALRYDTSRVRMEDVVTQPYDKITPEMQQRYYERSPYNLIRIILGKREPGDTEPADAPARQRVLGSLRVQGALTNCRKGAQEVLGVAEGFDDIRKQFVNNRIDTEELKNRLQTGIAEPLRTIAEQMYPELDRRLEELQARLDDSQGGPGLRDRARQQADEILLAMQKVLDRMIELEDFNQAIELLRNIIKTQDDLRILTEQRRKQKARELLTE